jgi:pimeloyl-ACP methyl ester carboxylesterase
VEERGWALIRKLWRDWSPGWELPPEEWAQLVATFEQPGVKKAALAYYRSMAGRSSEAAQRTRELLSGPFPVRTLALTGALDGCMDTRMHDLVMHDADFPRGLDVVRVEEAGHFLHQERPEEVNRILLEWLEPLRGGPD